MAGIRFSPAFVCVCLCLFIRKHLIFSDQITSLSKTCYYYIRLLRCIRPYLDSSTACTVATSIVHSKLDYCNSLFYKPPKSQLARRLQQIQNSFLVLSLKLLSPVISLLSYPLSTGSESLNALNTSFSHLPTKLFHYLGITQPPYHYTHISIQRSRSTRSLSVVTLARPPSSSSQKITDRSFRCASSPCFWKWNHLPLSLGQPHSGTSSSIFDSPIFSPVTSFSFNLPLYSSVNPSPFNSRLKTYMFHKSYSRMFHFLLPDCL